MEGYRVYLHFELLEALPKPRVARGKSPSLPPHIGDDPFQTGDYSQRDASLRTQQVKVIDDHAITWWVAHPDKSVMVVDIRPADK